VKPPEEQTILALDTSGTTLQLAIAFGGDRVVKSSEDVEMSHGRVITRKIADLLLSASLTVSQIDCLAVATGPGSFTGLRIGLSIAKGLAVGTGAVMVGVSMFDLAAWLLRERPSEVFHLIVPFKKDACFMADITAGQVDRPSLRAITYADLNEELRGEPAVVIGSNTAALLAAHGLTEAVEMLAFDAATIVEIARRRLTENRLDDPAGLEPLYLQKSQAEIRFEERHKKI
jgi:tRNA threonylcarbamoyl adenosine modification protein YeaZ